MLETPRGTEGSHAAALALAFAIAILFRCAPVAADAGPPFLTNDPGTPGPGHWEINLASMQTVEPGFASYQVPQIDANLGIGERLQLTFQIPYVLQMRTGTPTASGWSNAVLGAKWRFFDAGESGWQLSTFPQFNLKGSSTAEREGIAVDGPRLLLPLEAGYRTGPVSLNLEAGYYAARNGPAERILGVVLGRLFTPRLELDTELYADHVMGTTPQVITLDVGGRYRVRSSCILLFMAGRSVSGNGPGQVEYMGYFGVQILLADYGRSLARAP